MIKTPVKLLSAWSRMWSNLEGDRLHLVLLVLLYVLQGVPMGLDQAIPLILARRNVPYSEQAAFSISTYPFSMKVRRFIIIVLYLYCTVLYYAAF